MKQIKRIFIFLLIAFGFVTFGQTARVVSVPDGKTFAISLKLTGGKRTGWQWTKDEISFLSGHLKSKVMMNSEHFDAPFCKWTPDSVKKENIYFEATAKNPYISEIKWMGLVTGNKISGTATWKNGQGIQTYTYSGSLKK